ncbi:MAG: 2Fe-2S iron-sulfur cluster-binding protein, partial [Candidatus Freyarchaeota archaeon]
SRDESPHYDTFEVPLNGPMSVQDCLLYIRENLDPSLAFFVNCRLVTEVKDDITVEPLRKDKVIRDLWSADT